MTATLANTSKFLSYVLRHAPQDIGIALDTEGWTDIDTLLLQAAAHGREISRAQLDDVVQTSEKKRFSISADGRRIRAAQGHTTQAVALEHPVRTPPDTLYHGTATRFLDAILREGLKPGQRHHVHLSAEIATATEVGRRYGTPVILRVDARAMRAQGHSFQQADNGVWLAAAVPPQFLGEDGQAGPG
ncbi:RNA 2'-phosphotransferase [Achromobacter spanius]|uniref:RNA 2'-phosphotransferase n=1 Tax=Achromobacter spanius TaxID=217203 RepID=UPI00320AE3E9